MYSKLLVIVAAAASVAAQCPPVWNTISQELTGHFLTGGECNGNARQAIRAAFHDCGAWNLGQGETGGCDGSMMLAEMDRLENQAMAPIAAILTEIATRHSVSVADTIQFAASHAVVTCPGGPRVQTFVGRRDSTTPGPTGLLPPPDASGDDVLRLMSEKGFSVNEFVALIGAHTVSRQTFDPTRSGAPQDTTPGRWDTNFFSQTLSPPPEVFVIPADRNVAQHPATGPAFSRFAGQQRRFNGAFAPAMTKMSLFGVPGGRRNLIDCTSALPGGTLRRDVKAAPIADRV